VVPSSSLTNLQPPSTTSSAAQTRPPTGLSCLPCSFSPVSFPSYNGFCLFLFSHSPCLQRLYLLLQNRGRLIVLFCSDFFRLRFKYRNPFWRCRLLGSRSPFTHLGFSFSTYWISNSPCRVLQGYLLALNNVILSAPLLLSLLRVPQPIFAQPPTIKPSALTVPQLDSVRLLLSFLLCAL
jgi:hypothetical protein